MYIYIYIYIYKLDVVIIDVEDYVKEAEHQLNNKDAYKKLQYDPTQTHTRLVNDTISRFKNDKLITENIAKGLQVQQLETPKFYTRAKIHKTGNPGRPVISSVNCHTSTISKYVDFRLQPIVKNIPSYVRDTTDFLQKLDKVKNVPNDCLLATLDVKSLYTNIPNNEGIKAVREAYDNHPNKSVATKVIITFLSLILTLNNFFVFKLFTNNGMCNGYNLCSSILKYFHGTILKATYIYPYIKNKSILHLRYIDDIFMIWTGTKQELLMFLGKLNSKLKTIKFEHNISNSNISFLDTLIYKDKSNTLQTTLHQKPTDQQSHLHAYSNHPKSHKRSIPYTQVLRIKTICSTLTEYKKHCAILKQNFIER